MLGSSIRPHVVLSRSFRPADERRERFRGRSSAGIATRRRVTCRDVRQMYNTRPMLEAGNTLMRIKQASSFCQRSPRDAIIQGENLRAAVRHYSRAQNVTREHNPLFPAVRSMHAPRMYTLCMCARVYIPFGDFG